MFMSILVLLLVFVFFFQAEDGIRDRDVTGVQTCALPISPTAEGLKALPRTVTSLTNSSRPVVGSMPSGRRPGSCTSFAWRGSGIAPGWGGKTSSPDLTVANKCGCSITVPCELAK